MCLTPDWSQCSRVTLRSCTCSACDNVTVQCHFGCSTSCLSASGLCDGTSALLCRRKGSAQKAKHVADEVASYALAWPVLRSALPAWRTAATSRWLPVLPCERVSGSSRLTHRFRIEQCAASEFAVSRHDARWVVSDHSPNNPAFGQHESGWSANENESTEKIKMQDTTICWNRFTRIDWDMWSQMNHLTKQ